MIDTLTIDYLSQIYWVCFFVGFGLYLSCMLIASFVHFVKDSIKNSI